MEIDLSLRDALSIYASLCDQSLDETELANYIIKEVVNYYEDEEILHEQPTWTIQDIRAIRERE